MEAEILASTVRLELRVFAHDQDGDDWQGASSIGHATLIAGRYLLSHNHFSLSLEDFEDGRRRSLTVFRPDGEVLLLDVPFGAFTVIAAAPQMLLFDFGDYGQELFALVGLRSARLDPQVAGQLQPGMLVAQVNWDGYGTRVDWVRVVDIRDEEGTPILILDNFVEQGASGGGIFYEGFHLANNWFRRTERLEGGEVLQQVTAAALNRVTIPASPAPVGTGAETQAASAPATAVVEMEGIAQVR